MPTSYIGPGDSMNNKPLEIIDEFLNSESPQLRRNAITALASLHNVEAIKRMMQSALEDKDESVRVRAEEELATLDEQSQSILAKEFTVRLEDKSQRFTAYALLGRLRNIGLQLNEVTLNWLITWYLEFRLFKYVYPIKGWRLYLRTCIPTLKAGLFASIGYGLFFVFLQYSITRSLPENLVLTSLADAKLALYDSWSIFGSIFGFIIGMTILISVWLIPLTTFRSLARDLYPDRLKGALIELFWAGLAGLIIGSMNSKGVAIPMMLTMIAVRVGCISTHGVEYGYAPKHFAQTLAGTITGTLVLLAFLVHEKVEGTGGLGLVNYEDFFIYITAIIPAAANSYASIDIAHASALRQNMPMARLIAYGLPMLFAILVGVAFFPEPPCMPTGEIIQASADHNQPVVVPISQVPYCRNLVVGSEQQANINIQPQEDSHYGLRVLNKVLTYDASTVDSDGNVKNEIPVLDQGQYTLIFSRKNFGLLHKQMNSKNALPILFGHYNNLYNKLRGQGKSAIQPVNLSIAFTTVSKKSVKD